MPSIRNLPQFFLLLIFISSFSACKTAGKAEEKMAQTYYFSYGSNMHAKRLWERVPSAKFIAVACLTGYELKFNKKSKDESGKANILKSDGADVYGVLWQINISDMENLDKAEGLGYGYNKDKIMIHKDGCISPKSETVEALTYVGDVKYLDDTLIPYAWYKSFVVEGAKDHGLPEGYIAHLAKTSSKEDLNNERKQKNLIILNANN